MAGEFTKFTTVSQVLQKAYRELGLTVPTSFVGNTDDTASQLVEFLTSAGQDLCTMNDWQMLHKEWTQVLTPAVSTYALPTDWNSFIDSAMWDNTARWPVIGPLTPQIWRMLKARLLGGNTISLQYRIVANQFVLYYPAAAADTIVSDYYSRGWLVQVDGTTYRDNPSADSDTVLFDSRIIVPLLKFKWRDAKGFDTSAASAEFQEQWDLIVGRDIPAPTLSVGPRDTYPYLGYYNMPDTNYGS